MRSRSSRGLLCACAALGGTLSACEPSELTQVVVIVEAGPTIKARASHTALVVTGGRGGLPREAFNNQGAPRPAEFPYVIALTPREGDADSLYRIEVSALERTPQQTQTIAVARLLSGYVADQTVYVRLLLEDTCINVACGPTESCSAGRCLDARVAADQFGRDRAGAPLSSTLSGTLDASIPPPPGDAGAEAGPDVVVPPLPDASTPDAGTADTGTADTGAPPAPDAGVVRDAGVVAPDSGVPPAGCAPEGPWTFTYTERSGTCGFTYMPVTVYYVGSLDTLFSDPNCSPEVTPLSDDGCAIYYEQHCTTDVETTVAYETGTLEMIAPDRIVGAAQLLVMDYATGQSCMASVDVIAVPGGEIRIGTDRSAASATLDVWAPVPRGL